LKIVLKAFGMTQNVAADLFLSGPNARKPLLSLR
jgi:hypothetical protein